MNEIAKELFKDILNNTAGSKSFSDAIDKKMDQELSVRKVGLANKIYTQSTEK